LPKQVKAQYPEKPAIPNFNQHGMPLFFCLFFQSRFLRLAVVAACFISSVSYSQSRSTMSDSVTVAVAPGYDSVAAFHRFWLGNGYRRVWAAPVKLKVFRLQTERGGLTPVEGGGSRQTKSLRLRDKTGKQWVLRSVQKYPERGLPPYLRNTVAQRILQDQVVTVHPFGALTVPPLASALGIAHTNPQIVYVPDDPALGKFRSEFANSVLLFEERGAIDTFRTINTDVLQARLESGEEQTVDQKRVLRARLLDMLIGDWDRHEGQWRWEEKTLNGETVFSPVPNDRDYVFYNTTGVLPWLVGSQQSTARFQGFQNEIQHIETYNFNSRYFDRYFLNELTEQDWVDEIAQVQMTLTDGLIRNAVGRMPDTIFALTGEQIIRTLVARRSKLKENALSYFRFLSRYVDVPGSAKAEQFAIEHKPDGGVEVSIFSKGATAAKEKPVYRRSFDPLVTEEVRLYGMGGNDVFSVTGTESSLIKIRMIGGDGVDRFGVATDNPNRQQLYVYDRKDEENVYPKKGLRLRLSKDTAVNQFDRRSFRYNLSMPVVNLFYNIDQRTFFSFGWAFVKHGFRKEPYASRHEIVAGYSPVRGAFAFRYNADWRNVFGKYGLNFNLLSIGPRNQSNFFGTGNKSVFVNDNGKSLGYYRNRFDLVNADLRLTRHPSSQVTWNAGFTAQYYTSKEANNRLKYLFEYHLARPEERVFMSRVHAGLGAGVQVDTRSGGALPVKGLLLNVDLRAMQQLRQDKTSFGSARADMTLFTRLSRDSGLVLVNRAGAGTTVGDPAFYQMMQLGGPLTLRGYNLNRFTGHSMLYHNAEVRLKLFDFTSYLFPGSLGLIGFDDVGRVWLQDEKSTVWHHGYGGGIYIVPANVVLIRALLAHSREGNQFYFNFFYGL
jgi:hypothetical protein